MSQDKVLVLVQDTKGQTRNPVDKADLEALGLAKDASLAALVTALQALPRAATKGVPVTVDLSTARVDYLLALAPLARVFAVTVRKLTGATQTVTLKLGAPTAPALDLAAGDVRDSLNVTALYLNSPAQPGASISFELHGE